MGSGGFRWVPDQRNIAHDRLMMKKIKRSRKLAENPKNLARNIKKQLENI